METTNNLELKRRKHPTHDQEMIRHVFKSVLFMFSIFIIALRPLFGNWAVALGVTGFLAGVVFLLTKSVNRSWCPQCGAPLNREAFSTEFVCQDCNVVWVTRSFGQGISDIFFARGSHEEVTEAKGPS
jgi:hypothetical protein